MRDSMDSEQGNPELRDLKCLWEEPAKGHFLLHIADTYGDGTVTDLWLTRLQAKKVAEVIAALEHGPVERSEK